MQLSVAELLLHPAHTTAFIIRHSSLALLAHSVQQLFWETRYRTGIEYYKTAEIYLETNRQK